MTLREALGGDAGHVHEFIEQMLDREDCVIVMIDDRRALSYALGFGLSPCQLELVAHEVERGVRSIIIAPDLRTAHTDLADNGPLDARGHRREAGHEWSHDAVLPGSVPVTLRAVVRSVRSPSKTTEAK